MYKKTEVIAIIPARGGSKGLPRKNLVSLGDYPLIYWTIKRAQNSKYIDRVLISSDDDEILDYSIAVGAEIIKRPAKYATDNSSSVEVLMHALDTLSIKNTTKLIAFLQPTSPLRTTGSINKAIEYSLDNNYNYVMSVSSISKSPYHMYLESDDNLLIPLYNPQNIKSARRQDLPNTFISNGAIYLVKANYFYKQQSFKPNEIHSFKMEDWESIDIDTMEDLEIAEKVISNKKLKP